MNKTLELRKQLREKNPDFDSLSYQEQRRLWRESLGLHNPPVPSAQDEDRDASCLQCRDQGWLLHYRTLPNGESEYLGVIPCPGCAHWQEEKVQYALKCSGIPEAKKICNFVSFNWEVPGVGESANLAYELSKGTAKFKLLLLYGGTGNGKTHLAYAAVLEAASRGLNGKFEYVPSMFSKIRQAMDAKGQSADDIINTIKQCDFLALDDIGVRKETEWQQATLEEIINYRYANELPLIATTNKDPKGLGEAILSRFKDTVLSRMVLNPARDYRPWRAKA